jgi:hypothetical protein
MAIRKTTAVLSLAVLISFGLSGCEGSFSIGSGEPTSTQSSSTPAKDSEKTVENETEAVRAQTEDTLNELRSFSESEAFTAFYDDISAIANDDPDAMVKIEAILDKHQPLEDSLKEKIGLTPEALRGYQGIFAMSSASSKFPYSEKFINSAILFSALGDITGAYGSGEKDISFGVTSDAVSGKSGDYKLNTYGIFLKDAHNAVSSFPDSAFTRYGLENGGKKIIIEQVDGELREEHSADEQLKIDVKNAATTIETWIVYQGVKNVPLIVEDGKIVSGKTDKGNPEFSISDGISLKFEGDSYEYIITGTSDTTGETVVYDSANGGLQKSKNSPSKAEKSSVKYDLNAFQEVQSAYLNSTFKNKDLGSFVDYLNSSEYTSDAQFEVVEKGGEEYIKVTDPDTKILEKELLYVSPTK